MSPEVLSLPRALTILEIFNPQELEKSDLGRIRKRAMRRWRPDRIAYTKPSEEEVQKYKTNFRLVEPAIEIVQRYLQGEIHVTDKFSESFMGLPIHEDPFTDIAMSAGELQHDLRQRLEKARRSQHKVTYVKEILHDGFYIRDLLRIDIDDRALVMGWIALCSGLTWIPLATFVPAVLLNDPTSSIPNSSGLAVLLSNTLLGAGMIGSLLHVMACLIAMLPLSRYWLPNILHPPISFFVDGLGIGPHNFLMRTLQAFDPNLGCMVAQLLGLFCMIMGLYFFSVRITATIINWVLVIPLYKIAQYLVSDRKTAPLYEHICYFAGVAEWFVEELLSTPPEQLEYDELRVLSHLYAAYAEVEQ